MLEMGGGQGVEEGDLSVCLCPPSTWSQPGTTEEEDEAKPLFL